MNVGREYRSEWHDMMVELGGPVVLSLENEFRLDWAHASALGDLAYLAALIKRPKRLPSAPSTETTSEMRLLPTKTLHKPLNTAVLGALRNARAYIYVEHPYLFDKGVITRLAEARNRGVDVRVIFPRVNDSRSGTRVEAVTANYLLEHGVRVFFYPGMTHVKALLLDGWAAVGSANLNQFGLRLDQEHNIGTSDPEFCEELKKRLFEEDFAHSQEMMKPLMLEWRDFLTEVVLEGL
jgi:cardiolipin synthase